MEVRFDLSIGSNENWTQAILYKLSHIPCQIPGDVNSPFAESCHFFHFPDLIFSVATRLVQITSPVKLALGMCDTTAMEIRRGQTPLEKQEETGATIDGGINQCYMPRRNDNFGE